MSAHRTMTATPSWPAYRTEYERQALVRARRRRIVTDVLTWLVLAALAVLCWWHLENRR